MNGSHERVEVEEEIDQINENDEEDRRKTKVKWFVPAARREYPPRISSHYGQ